MASFPGLVEKGGTVDQLTSMKVGNISDQMFDDDDLAPVGGGGKAKQAQGVMKEPQSLVEACQEGVLSYVVIRYAQGGSMAERDPSAGATLLMWAALKGAKDVVRFLVTRKVDVNAQDNRGQSALMWAAIKNEVALGEYLLEHGADSQQVDERGCDAHCLAIQNGSAAFLYMMQKFSPLDPAKLDNDGHTLLVWAAYKGHLSIVRYLKEMCDVPHALTDKQDRNALHWAAREGHTAVCAYLMGLGLSPTKKDIDGCTPQEWAETRHHVEANTALKKNQTVLPATVIGTFQVMGSHRDMIAMTLLGVAAVLGQLFIVTWFFPAAITYTAMGLYLSKNMILGVMYRTPVYNSRPEATLAEMIAIPKNMTQSMRGIPKHNYRAPENITILATYYCVQVFCMMHVGVEVTLGFHAATLTALLLAAVVKARAFRDVVANGSVIDDPLQQAVKAKNYADALEPRVILATHNLRIPLRAFWCKELDAVVRGFDSWSLFLDAAISRSNRVTYVLFLAAFAVQQAIVLTASWAHLAAQFCPAGADAKPQSYGQILFNLAFSALPCAEPLGDDKSWKAFLMPTKSNTAGLWLIVYTLMILFLLLTTIWRQLMAVGKGASRIELSNPTAPASNGGLTGIMRGSSTVYSEGSAAYNILLFFMGRFGERWASATSVPEQQKH
jgi:hypothetical protein